MVPWKLLTQVPTRVSTVSPWAKGMSVPTVPAPVGDVWMHCPAGLRMEVNELTNSLQCTSATQDPHDVWLRCVVGELEADKQTGKFRCADSDSSAVPTWVRPAVDRCRRPRGAEPSRDCEQRRPPLAFLSNGHAAGHSRQRRTCPVAMRTKGPTDSHGQYDQPKGFYCDSSLNHDTDQFVDYVLPEGVRWGDFRDRDNNFDLGKLIDAIKTDKWHDVPYCQHAPMSMCNDPSLLPKFARMKKATRPGAPT